MGGSLAKAKLYYMMLSVDDGTGVINCKYWLPTETDASQEKHKLQYLQGTGRH